VNEDEFTSPAAVARSIENTCAQSLNSLYLTDVPENPLKSEEELANLWPLKHLTQLTLESSVLEVAFELYDQADRQFHQPGFCSQPTSQSNICSRRSIQSLVDVIPIVTIWPRHSCNRRLPRQKICTSGVLCRKA